MFDSLPDYKEQLKQDKANLSKVAKLPGHSISGPARLGNVWQKLRKIKGSTCEKCYALKGMYNMPNVKQAMERREVFFHSIDFVPRMVAVLNTLRKPEFRWFDSGDCDSVAMGHNILDVCEATPHLVHWIPSREYKIWGDVLRTRNLPANVTLRMSPHIINDATATAWQNTSTVASDGGNIT